MHEALKITATAINAAYAATADNPAAHEAIDDLRQNLANQFALSGLCSYGAFSDLARTLVKPIRYVVDGHIDCDADSDLAGDGEHAPFRIFHPDTQDYLPGKYATRAQAQVVADALNEHVL